MNPVVPVLISKSEGFTQVLTCPSGATSFVTSAGDTECCNGEVIDNWCNGNVICSLSSSKNGCSQYVQSMQAAESAAKCSPTISANCSNYFINQQTGVRGCSVSVTTPDGSAPADLTKPYCRLYATDAMNKANFDSCFNYTATATKLASCAAATATSKIN